MEHAGDSSPLLELDTVVVFVDVVESVRLLQQDERQAIALLRALISRLLEQAVEPLGGTLVERQGDGLLLRFERAQDAVRSGLRMHELACDLARGAEPGKAICLRVGIHGGRLLSDTNNLYGNALNLAARLLQVANAGETVVTNAVRDVLTDDVDARIDDLGFCFLKHWDTPVRLWRISPPQAQAPHRPPADSSAPDARQSIAVLRFAGAASLTPGLGDFLNGALVGALTKQPNLRVTSPLSATRLREGAEHAGTNALHLGVRYALTGSMQQLGGRLVVNPQLIDTHSDEVIWADQVMAPLDDWIQVRAQPVLQILEACVHALNEAYIRQTQHRPLPQLDSHALMAGAVALMHRASGIELARSEAMLQAVIDRHRRAAEPKAWLAKWHVLASVQGVAQDPGQAYRQAIDCASRALDTDPDHAIALAIQGHALCHEGRAPERALQVLQHATRCNPNEASAWLYLSAWHHMWGEAQAAIDCAQMSLQLSPLDPLRAHQEMMLGSAYMAAGEIERAIDAYGASIARNRVHLPALRALVAAYFEAGQEAQARAALSELLKLQPELTIKGYLAGGAANPIRNRVAYALAQLGVS
ncbi:adenylate/guanylate cyclase domain-containing protein [Hydrogenophaga sp. MI9]|uniref:adenylate/guanylate cyclase domain-containing protein n=1 Tax=Hydrogenophaga sp. MI9 TaxID=3453719 RepID=UPI003EEE57B9